VPCELDLGLISTVGVMGAVQGRPTPRVQRWRIALDPTAHGGVVDPHPTVPQQFFHVTIAQGIPQRPPHRAQDDVGFKVPPFA
jgi:hypothetical protein